MFLAEAVKEKDYLKESITKLCDRIQWLSTTVDELDAKLTDNKNVIISKISESHKKLSGTLSTVQSTINHHSKVINFAKIFTIISSASFFILLVIIIYKLYFV